MMTHDALVPVFTVSAGTPTASVLLDCSAAVLHDNRYAADLVNTLLGLSGIVDARPDRGSHGMKVEYNPDFVTPSRIQAVINGAGYGPGVDGTHHST